MLCLQCSHDNLHPGPECSECHAFIGNLAENQGYLPQLEALQHQLVEHEVTEEQARERLQRLEQALLYMLGHMSEARRQLAALGMDRGLGPVMEGLEKQRVLVTGLNPNGDWSEEQWEELHASQHQIVASHSGVIDLAEKVAAEFIPDPE